MPQVVHYWADLQSVHQLRCYSNITRTQNVSEYMLVLALCLVLTNYYVNCNCCCQQSMAGSTQKCQLYSVVQYNRYRILIASSIVQCVMLLYFGLYNFRYSGELESHNSKPHHFGTFFDLEFSACC